MESFVCSICDIGFDEWKNYFIHLRTVHAGKLTRFKSPFSSYLIIRRQLSMYLLFGLPVLQNNQQEVVEEGNHIENVQMQEELPTSDSMEGNIVDRVALRVTKLQLFCSIPREMVSAFLILSSSST